jgi:hypothetical protein
LPNKAGRRVEAKESAISISKGPRLFVVGSQNNFLAKTEACQYLTSKNKFRTSNMLSNLGYGGLAVSSSRVLARAVAIGSATGQRMACPQ